MGVYAFGTTSTGWLSFRCVSSTEILRVFLVFSFPPRRCSFTLTLPLCAWIPSVLGRCVQTSCTPWVNYFVSLWIFLTSNKGINQTSASTPLWLLCFLLLFFCLVLYHLITLEGRMRMLSNHTTHQSSPMLNYISVEVENIFRCRN